VGREAVSDSAASTPKIRPKCQEAGIGGRATLADRIAQGPIPLDEALPIAQQIAEALEYAHEKGVIHRDLKPGNVEIAPEDKVKILDFGVSVNEVHTVCVMPIAQKQTRIEFVRYTE